MLTSDQVHDWADYLQERLKDHEKREDTASWMLEQLAFLTGWVIQCVRAEGLPPEALEPLSKALTGLYEAGETVEVALRH